MRNPYAVWLVTDAFDWSSDGADEPMDGTGVGEQVDNTPTPRTPTRVERHEHECVSRAMSTRVSVVCHVEELEGRQWTLATVMRTDPGCLLTVHPIVDCKRQTDWLSFCC